MGLPIKVFILGSCVSRDPFEIADKNDLAVVGYYARSSFASLGSTPFVDEKILSGVKSNWQRRMVRADMEKSVFSALGKTDFDVLLIDLIDERFSLSVNGSSVHTISTEYKKALYKPSPYGFVKSGSEEKLRLWRQGLEKISQYLAEHGLDDKVVVNQVYWSLRCQHPEQLLDRYSEAQFKQTNEQLEWMYEEIKITLPKSRFITYSDEELEIDDQHKWGMDPFHYTKKAHLKQLDTILFYIDEKKKIVDYSLDKTYESIFMYEGDRPADVQEIKMKSVFFIRSENLRIEYRYSSLVVFLYKCIETNDKNGLREGLIWGESNAEKLISAFKVTNKGIRADTAQVVISFLTSAWHAKIFICESPVSILLTLKNIVERYELPKASYSQNVGKGLLLLSFFLFKMNKDSDAKEVINLYYRYFCQLLSHLNADKPIGSSHLGDVQKCMASLQCALAGLEWINGSRKRENLWNFKKVSKLVSRVDDSSFISAYLSVLNKNHKFRCLNDSEILNNNSLVVADVFGDDLKKLKEIFKLIDDDNLAFKFIDSAVNNNYIKLCLPSFGDYFCNKSFIYKQQNFLVFSHLKNKDKFILGQRHKIVSEVILPTQRVLLKIDRAPSYSEVIIENYGGYIFNEDLGFDKNMFKGVYLSYGRPYHYFYDLLPSFLDNVRKIKDKKLLEKVVINEVNGQSFLSVKKLGFENKVCVYEDEREINSQVGFFLKLGYPVLGDKKYKHDSVEYFDSFLVNSTLLKIEKSTNSERKDDLLKIWIGICDEKRSWKEQKKGIRNCLNNILRLGFKLEIYADGLTRPLGCEKDSFVSRYCESEIDLFHEIFGVYELNDRVKVFNLIGESAELKIETAFRIDFFITNFLTDSMYPARFGRKPGVGHGSYAMKAVDHVHENTVILKSNKERDLKILVNKSSNWARQSYSIQSGKIWAAFEPLIVNYRK